ncbi:hypothetical protein AVEN_37593-1 [Araneus ventricosus]|uniref:Constitutive coactivator of peroxisome proliferator-activated receptor gamma n=1 Tax=Araneus ventricosus TaxID=182803 RepID=A0A4Y2I7G1_ARAVE|nr:hypothetical protein AVEN_37593-1 [Araneus ventricosus]
MRCKKEEKACCFAISRQEPHPWSKKDPFRLAGGTLFSCGSKKLKVPRKGAGPFSLLVDGGHLLQKVVWQRNMNFGDIAKSYLTYLQTHYGSNVAVVFDGYPSDVNGKSTKSAERIRRANLHSSHEIIFNEATCPEISQEQFLANERNKVRFIDLLKKFLQKANVTVKQAVEDANILIVKIAVSVKSQYDNIFVVGENIDFLVLLTGLAPMKENL